MKRCIPRKSVAAPGRPGVAPERPAAAAKRSAAAGKRSAAAAKRSATAAERLVTDPGKPVAAPSYSVVYISQENTKKRCKCYYKGFYTLNLIMLASLRGVKVKLGCCGASAPSSSPFIRSAKKFFLKESLRKYKCYQVFHFISSAAIAQLAKQAAGMQQQST